MVPRIPQANTSSILSTVHTMLYTLMQPQASPYKLNKQTQHVLLLVSLPQVRHTLHGWLAASGHPDLWQLLSHISTPAWKLLVGRATMRPTSLGSSRRQQTPAAAASCSQSPGIRSATAIGSGFRGAAATVGESSCSYSSRGKCSMLADGPGGAAVGRLVLDAMCPAPLQQLLQLLVCTPSYQGLLKLLQLLPVREGSWWEGDGGPGAGTAVDMDQQQQQQLPGELQQQASTWEKNPNPRKGVARCDGKLEEQQAAVEGQQGGGEGSCAAAISEEGGLEAACGNRVVVAPKGPPAPWELGWPDEMDWEGEEKLDGMGLSEVECSGAIQPAGLFLTERELHNRQAAAGCYGGQSELPEPPQQQQQQQEEKEVTVTAIGQENPCQLGGTWWQQQLLTSGWELVLEHRCWYDYSLWLLVHVAVQLQMKGGAAAGSRGADQLLSQQEQQQQKRQELIGQATAAAAYISWVLEPWSEPM